MSDSPTNPDPPRSRPHHEYEDPHFHDEDLEIQQDDTGHRPNQPPARRKPTRRVPPPRRRHYED